MSSVPNPLRNRGAAVGDHLHYMKVRTDPARWAARKEQVNKARRAWRAQRAQQQRMKESAWLST